MAHPDYVKFILAFIAALSLAFNIFQYFRSNSRFTLNIHQGQLQNEDGVGVYLAGILSVSNTGKTPAYFSGVKINQFNDDYYYPKVGIELGIKIEPGQTVQGGIPVGHLLNNEAKELIVLDGVWKEYKINKRIFSKFLTELTSEKERLEKIGASVHPRSSIGA